MDVVPADGVEELQLILAACKFLDLLLVIQSEDFQMSVSSLRATGLIADINGFSSQTRRTPSSRQKTLTRTPSWTRSLISCRSMRVT